MSIEQYTLSTNAVAAAVGCDPQTLRHYADQGLLQCLRLASGVRLFRPSAVQEAVRLREAGIARRGNRRSKKATICTVNQETDVA